MNKKLLRYGFVAVAVVIAACSSRESDEAKEEGGKSPVTNGVRAVAVSTTRANSSERKVISASTNRVVGAKKKPALAERLPPLPPKKPHVIPPATQVLVRVNGIDITRGKVDRYANFMAALLKNKSPKISEAMLRKFKAKNYKRFSDTVYLETLLSTCLVSSNVVVSSALKNSVEKNFLRQNGTKKQTIEQLKSVIAKAGYLKDLESQLAAEAKVMAFVSTVYSNQYYVADADIAKYRKKVAEFNKRASLTNEVTLALAKRVAARAQKGEDFAKLIETYSQEPDKGTVQKAEDFDEHDFEEDKHVWRALQELKPGEATGVLEIEDGYAIYKVLKKVTPEESNSGVPSLRVARIFFRRAFKFAEQTDEEFRANVEKEVRDKLMMDVVKAFRRQSKVERPNGSIAAE